MLVSPYTSSHFIIYIDLYVKSDHFLFKDVCDLLCIFAGSEYKSKKSCSGLFVCLLFCFCICVGFFGCVCFVLYFFSFHFNYSTSFLTNNTANNQLLKWKHYLLSVLLIYFFRDSKLAMELNGGNPSYGTCKAIWHFKLLAKCLTGAADF